MLLLVSARPPVDLACLLARAGKGEPLAWAELIGRYGGLLRDTCRQQRLTPEQTADVIQITWLRLFTHADGIRNPNGVVTWLRTTATRECYALKRREWRELPTPYFPEQDLDISAADVTVDLDERLEARRLHVRLHQAIAMLPAREREVIEIMLAPEPASYAEISARLAMPVGAIGPVRQRALRRLRGWLVEDLDSHPARQRPPA